MFKTITKSLETHLKSCPFMSCRIRLHMCAISDTRRTRVVRPDIQLLYVSWRAAVVSSRYTRSRSWEWWFLGVENGWAHSQELQTELARARQEIADLSAAKIALEREYEEVLARESLSQRSSSQQQEQLKRLHQLIQQQQEKRQDELHLMQEQSSLLLNQMQEQSSQMQLSAQEVDRLKNASAKDAQHLEQLKKQVAELTQTCAAYEKETKELTQMCAAYEKETKMLKFYMSTLPIHSKNN